MASDVETGAATDKWALYSGGFYMRAADGEDGKLTRLVDVRDWLMRRHEWPMDRAANEVIAALNQGVENGCALFIADTKRYAVAMREDAHFLSPDEIKERGGLRHIDERLLGFKGLCNAILNGWVGEYAGYLRSGRLDAACVTLKDAQELWGWGTVAAVGPVATAEPAPVAAPADPLAPLDADLRKSFEDVCKRRASSKDKKNGARESWSAGDVETVRKAREALGRAGAAAIAPLLGMTADAVRDLLDRKQKQRKKEVPEAPTPTAHIPFPTTRKRAA
jgi:hypothetical protein